MVNIDLKYTAMRKLIIIIVCVFIVSALSAQIEEEIKTFVDTTEIYINNGRAIIAKSLIKNDLDKVEQTYKFLKGITDQSSLPSFYYREEIAINFLIKDWEQLSTLLVSYSRDYDYNNYGLKAWLGRDLNKKIVEHYDSISSDLEKALIDEETKLFLKLLLYLAKEDVSDELYREKYNEFKKKYTETKYREAFDCFVYQPFGPASLSLFLGPSYGFPESGKRFGNMMGVYAGIDININRTYFSLYFVDAYMLSTGNYTIEKDGETYNIEKGDEFNFVQAGLAVGYFYVRRKWFNLSNYINFSSVQISTDEFNPNKTRTQDDLSITTTMGLGLGLHSEVRLFDIKPKNRKYGYNFQNSHVNLKVDFEYTYPIQTAIPSMEEKFFLAKIGLVWSWGEK
jgi:hypothetical protein